MLRLLKNIYGIQLKNLVINLTILMFLSINLAAQNGVIKSYYGPKQLRAKLSFANDVLDGTCFWYYENGNLKSEKTYSNGKLHGLVKEFQESGLPKEEYYVNYGIKDGIYKSYWENGALKEVRTYDSGILVKRVTIDFDPFFVPSVDSYAGAANASARPKEEVICDAEICASPIGGTKAIEERIDYPEEALLYGLEGTVTLVVTINEDGFAENVLVLRGIGLGCDEAAVEAVKKSRFLPGQNGGKIVKSNLTLDLKFSIEDSRKVKSDIASIQQKYDISEPEIESLISDDENDTRVTYYNPEKSATSTKIDEPTENKIDNSEEFDEGNNKNNELIVDDNVLNPLNVKPETKKISYINFSCNVEKCPEPKGGMAAIMENFKVPSKAKELKVYGDVVISAEIDKFGNVRNTKVLENIGYGCEVAAEVAILETKFNPGKQNNERVDSELIIIIPVRPELN